MDMRASYGMFPKSPGPIWTTLGVHHGSYAHTMHVRSSQTPKLGSCKRGFQHRKLVKMMESAVAGGCDPCFFSTNNMLGETALRDSACV